jgi:putative PIN family toxin of toxin-antitoxin system
MMIRAVLDTNVLVSALIKPEGKPGRILRQVESGYELVLSEYILAELVEVLGRKHIQAKYRPQVTAENRTQYLKGLRATATIVRGGTDVAVELGDQKDKAILSCAVEGQADYVVTGDPHLLRLGSLAEIRIVTPEEFLRILEPGS